MARNQFGGFGGPNMQQLMRQAQKMQQQMEQAQADLETKEYEAFRGRRRRHLQGKRQARNRLSDHQARGC